MGQGQSDEGKIKGAFLLPGKEPDFNTCKHLTSGNSFMILRLVLYHGSKRQNKRVVFWRQWEGTTPPTQTAGDRGPWDLGSGSPSLAGCLGVVPSHCPTPQS